MMQPIVILAFALILALGHAMRKWLISEIYVTEAFWRSLGV